MENTNPGEPFGPEFRARLERQTQAMNIARSLLSPKERQVLDIYYDALAKRLDKGVLKNGSEGMEAELDRTPKPNNFEEIQAKLADLYDVIYTSGLANVGKK